MAPRAGQDVALHRLLCLLDLPRLSLAAEHFQEPRERVWGVGIRGREGQEPIHPVDVEADLGVGNAPSVREEGGVAGAPIGDHCVGPHSRVFRITLP